MKLGSLVTGIIVIVIAFLMFGIVLDAVDALVTRGLGDYTGLEAIVTISPMLIFLGLLAGGGWLTFTGLRGEGGGKAGRRLH